MAAETLKFNLAIKKQNSSTLSILKSIQFQELGIKKQNSSTLAIRKEVSKSLVVEKVIQFTMGLT